MLCVLLRLLCCKQQKPTKASQEEKRERWAFLRETQVHLMEPNNRNIAGPEEGAGRTLRLSFHLWLKLIFAQPSCFSLLIIFLCFPIYVAGNMSILQLLNLHVKDPATWIVSILNSQEKKPNFLFKFLSFIQSVKTRRPMVPKNKNCSLETSLDESWKGTERRPILRERDSH